jgi:hypothetical protein
MFFTLVELSIATLGTRSTLVIENAIDKLKGTMITFKENRSLTPTVARRLEKPKRNQRNKGRDIETIFGSVYRVRGATSILLLSLLLLLLLL